MVVLVCIELSYLLHCTLTPPPPPPPPRPLATPTPSTHKHTCTHLAAPLLTPFLWYATISDAQEPLFSIFILIKTNISVRFTSEDTSKGLALGKEKDRKDLK